LSVLLYCLAIVLSCLRFRVGIVYVCVLSHTEKKAQARQVHCILFYIFHTALKSTLLYIEHHTNTTQFFSANF
jgi:hypothetical protein